VLLDEWQTYPGLWNMVRHEVDDRRAKGQFVLTGSATPDDDARRHSGAGRFAILQMRPMSLYESGHSSGKISLASLFEGETPSRWVDPAWDARVALTSIAERVTVGGWPGNLGLGTQGARRLNQEYVRLIQHNDIPRIDQTPRDPDVAAKVMRSFSRGIATRMSERTIARDVRRGEPLDRSEGDDATSRNAVATHLSALRRLKIVEDQDAWQPSLRSARQLQTIPKRHFVDPSIAVACLDASPRALADDLLVLGHLFESLVLRDLRVYAQPLRGRALFYRDSKNLEVDTILVLPDGRWAAIEVKLSDSPEAVNSAIATLNAMTDQVADSRCAFKAVITNGGTIRTKGDIHIIPITHLAP
jgi:predicted AAA+ superfamily ATPase